MNDNVIEVDGETVRGLCRKLEDLQNELENKIKELSNEVENLQNIWSGSDAMKYQDTMRLVIEQLYLFTEKCGEYNRFLGHAPGLYENIDAWYCAEQIIS